MTTTTTTTTATSKKTDRRHRGRCNTIQWQPQQRGRCRRRCRLHHYQRHYYGVDCLLTAFWLAILIAVHVCYGDQIESDPDDMDTMGLSQVQFKKHHSSRQVVNYGLTLHDSQLLRDETINGDGGGGDGISIATLVPQPSSSQSKRAAHHALSAKKSNRNFKTTTTSAIESITAAATATPIPSTPLNRFNMKRDWHRQAHQSRNLIGNASSPSITKPFTQYKYAIDNTSYYARNSDGTISPLQLRKTVPSSSVKPKIQLPAKLFNNPSSSASSASSSLHDYHRTPSNLSYNLVRDQAQKTQQFQLIPTTAAASAVEAHRQSSKSHVYKAYHRPPSVIKPNRNNCNQCRIIPGIPRRHKPNRIRYYGM